MGRVEPGFEEFVALAKQGSVVPVSREMLADGLTPVVAYATVGDGVGSYLLESVVGGEKWARYSFVGFEPDLIVRGIGDRYEEERPDGLRVRRVSDPWAALRETLALYKPPQVPWLPRFWGGAVGYVAYDAVRRFEPTVSGQHAQANDECHFAFSISGTLLIFDNLTLTIRIVVPVRIDDHEDLHDTYAAAVARIDRAQQRLHSPAALRIMRPPRKHAELEIPPSSFDREGYCAAVERCKEHIRAGDIFQVVLSQRFKLPSAGIDPFDIYRALRVINPSPYMYFLRFAHLRIAGASPEVMVRLEHGRAIVRPIAGTRPRGATVEEDAAIESELFSDPKELSEHVMLVDLGRNDLGRISKPGSVRVSERMVCERYSHVMHITSNVHGELAPGRDAIDVLRATFPAGTLSGAPKVRAMQIIEAQEPTVRNVYGGAVGYLGFDGNMDFAIAIRTVVEQSGELTVQAGAGIVEGSRPEAEYEECVNKARAALAAIAAARSG
ncbi:MAG TPA: anthranilate synthase component I family protein [Polyangiales bacterium]|nr:anthranilate synthase component I family protein [Polyangiales bacterium]